MLCKDTVQEKIKHMSCTGWAGGLTRLTRMLCKRRVLSPSGDKIFILWTGMVMTLRMVVLVWFTNVLAEYVHAIMIAKNIELKQYFNLNSHPFTDRSLS